jgi:hypothetical protein
LNPHVSNDRTPLGAPHPSPRLGVLALALVVAGGSVGCEEEDSVTTARADVETDPAPGEPIDFGVFVLEEDDPLEDDYRRTVSIRNVGTANLQIFSLGIEGVDAGEYFISQAPSVVGPGGESTIFIRFSPTVHNVTDAELVLITNDLADRELRWPLVGDARDPCRLAMSPSSLRFELQQTRQVEIRTLTQSSCTISFLDTDETLFQLKNDIELPLTIEPGQPLVLDVEHDYFQPLLLPGEPVRQLRAIAEHGQRAEVDLVGVTPIFGCIHCRAPIGEHLVPAHAGRGAGAGEPSPSRTSATEPVRIRGLTGSGPASTSSGWSTRTSCSGFDVPPFEIVEFEVEFNALPAEATRRRKPQLMLTADTRNPQFRRGLTGTAHRPRRSTCSPPRSTSGRSPSATRSACRPARSAARPAARCGCSPWAKLRCASTASRSTPRAMTCS